MGSIRLMAITLLAVALHVVALLGACEKKTDTEYEAENWGPQVQDCNVVKFTTVDGFSTCAIRCIWVHRGSLQTESTEVPCGSWYGKKFKMGQ